ncbi:MAG: response regulator [Polyangiaceae bacterium]
MTARPSVLVVDDETSARMTLEALLKPDQLDPTFAQDGPGALRTLETAPVDLVVSDVLMPELDGFGLVTAFAPTRTGDSSPSFW